MVFLTMMLDTLLNNLAQPISIIKPIYTKSINKHAIAEFQSLVGNNGIMYLGWTKLILCPTN